MELCQYFTVLNSRKLLPENSGEERGTGPTPQEKLNLLQGPRWAAHNVGRTREVAKIVFGDYKIERLQSIRRGLPISRGGDAAQKLGRAGITVRAPVRPVARHGRSMEQIEGASARLHAADRGLPVAAGGGVLLLGEQAIR